MLEAALFTTDSEPDIVPALHFPRLTLIKTDKELDPRSEGARNKDEVDGGTEISSECAVAAQTAKAEAAA